MRERAGDGQHSDAPSELGLCPAGVGTLGGCGSRQVHAGSSAGFLTSHLKQDIAPRTGTQGLFSPQILSREMEKRSGAKLLVFRRGIAPLDFGRGKKEPLNFLEKQVFCVDI